MTVYFKLDNVYCEDGKFVWKIYNEFDPESASFDVLIQKTIKSIMNDFRFPKAVDAYITERKTTVNGDTIISFSMIMEDMIKDIGG